MKLVKFRRAVKFLARVSLLGVLLALSGSMTILLPQGSGDSVDWIAGLCDQGVSCAIGGPFRFDEIDVVDGVGLTSNNSFLELGGTGGNQIGLLQGCANNEIPKWVEASSVWNCAADVSGGTPEWESLVNGTSGTTAYTSDNVLDILRFDDQAARANAFFQISQTVGNPTTAGIQFGLTAVDPDHTLFSSSRAVDGSTVLGVLNNATAADAGTNETTDFRFNFNGDEGATIQVGKTEDYQTGPAESSFFGIRTRTDGTTAEAGRFLLNGVLDMAIGFRIGGAGTANQVLKGDGTNITLAALVEGDLPTTALLEGDAGLGMVINAGAFDIDLIDVTDAAGSASNNSGLEFGGTGAADIGLLRACTINQILKWDGTALWECQDDEDTNPLDITTCDAVTLSTGSVTLVGGANSVNCAVIDTEASAAQDDWSAVVCTAGSWWLTKAADSARTVTLVTGLGASDKQVQFDHVDDRAMLECSAANTLKMIDFRSNGV